MFRCEAILHKYFQSRIKGIVVLWLIISELWMLKVPGLLLGNFAVHYMPSISSGWYPARVNVTRTLSCHAYSRAVITAERSTHLSIHLIYIKLNRYSSLWNCDYYSYYVHGSKLLVFIYCLGIYNKDGACNNILTLSLCKLCLSQLYAHKYAGIVLIDFLIAHRYTTECLLHEGYDFL